MKNFWWILPRKTSSTEGLEGLISQMFYIFMINCFQSTGQCASFFTVARMICGQENL